MSDLAWTPKIAVHGLTVCTGVGKGPATYRDVLTKLGAPSGDPFAFKMEELFLPYIAVGPVGSTVRLRIDLQHPDGLFGVGWVLDEFVIPKHNIDGRVAICHDAVFPAPGMYWFVMHDTDDLMTEYARVPLYVDWEENPDAAPSGWS